MRRRARISYCTHRERAISGDQENTVEMVRLCPNGLVNYPPTFEVAPVTFNGKTAPGLDGATSSQDFALYVYNAS